MKPTPPGWPRISSGIFYVDAAAAIDFLVAAFGFAVRVRIDGDNNTIEHSELTFGDDGLIMVSSIGPRHPTKTSPQRLGRMTTQAMSVFVDDVDAHCAHARAAGAVIVSEPKTTDYGEGYWVDRTYECTDREGHAWWFMQRLSTSSAPQP